MPFLAILALIWSRKLAHWVHFGGQNGAKQEPESVQNRSKNQCEKQAELLYVLEAFLRYFGRILGGKHEENQRRKNGLKILSFNL